MKNREGVNRDLVDDTVDISLDIARITETRPFKNVDRENANKWKMTLI